MSRRPAPDKAVSPQIEPGVGYTFSDGQSSGDDQAGYLSADSEDTSIDGEDFEGGGSDEESCAFSTDEDRSDGENSNEGEGVSEDDDVEFIDFTSIERFEAAEEKEATQRIIKEEAQENDPGESASVANLNELGHNATAQ